VNTLLFEGNRSAHRKSPINVGQKEMRTNLSIAFCVLLLTPIYADTLHVVKDNPGALPPYDAWTNAAPDLQVAVDATSDGDTVLVSNGLFNTGGRPLDGGQTNRVVVTNAISVIGVNGPSATTIEGQPDPVSTNGNAAVRCIYLADGASLSGFTLTNGATLATGQGGGAYCESSNSLLSSCFIVGNSGYYGGGVYRGTLRECLVSGNHATWNGGGAHSSILHASTVTVNSAYYSGGGLYGSILFRCKVLGNSVDWAGGGGYQCVLYNSVVANNNSGYQGGGICEGRLYNCTVICNTGSLYTGGVFLSNLANSHAVNCIIYFNDAPIDPNCGNDGAYTNCCTTPAPSGPGHTTNDPALLLTTDNSFLLTAASPCIDAGTNQEWMTGSTDIDSQARIFHERVDIGADEAVVEATSLRGSGVITSSWNTVVGATCQLEFATSPTATVWNTHGSVITATENSVHFVLTNDAATTEMLRLNWMR